MINLNSIGKAITVGATLIGVYSLFVDKNEYSLPSMLRDDMYRQGLNPDNPSSLTDEILIKNGYDPIWINHLMYGKNHPKYRRK